MDFIVVGKSEHGKKLLKTCMACSYNERIVSLKLVAKNMEI